MLLKKKSTVKYWVLGGGKREYLWQILRFSPVSSPNKTDCHDITEMLLKVDFNTITLTPNKYNYMMQEVQYQI